MMSEHVKNEYLKKYYGTSFNTSSELNISFC